VREGSGRGGEGRGKRGVERGAMGCKDEVGRGRGECRWCWWRLGGRGAMLWGGASRMGERGVR